MENMKNSNIPEIIGHNIRAIQKRMNLDNQKFYELIYPGKKADIGTKRNKISNLVKGRAVTLDDLIAISSNTHTSFSELFTGIDEKNKADATQSAYDICKSIYTLFMSGMFNIESTSELQKKGKVISIASEKEELENHFSYITDISALDYYDDAPFGAEIEFNYPHPIYLRIMPRYFLACVDAPNCRIDKKYLFNELDESLIQSRYGTNIEKGDSLQALDRIPLKEFSIAAKVFSFLNNIAELKACNLPVSAKKKYIDLEFSKISTNDSNQSPYITVGYASYDGEVPLTY